MAKKPNPIDIYVGLRVKSRRLQLKLSQEALGKALSVTFQQVQKYEKGSNRISASRLVAISRILKIAPAYFFEDSPGNHIETKVSADALNFGKFIAEQGGMKIMEYWHLLSPSERGAFGDVLRCFALRIKR